MSQPQNKYYNNELLTQLSFVACSRYEELLAALDVRYTKAGKMVVGCCPVHHGDNPSAFNFYHDGDEVAGIWFCRTHHCEKEWKKTLFGLVRAVKNLSWPDAVDWVIDFCGYKSMDDITYNDKISNQQKYVTTFKKLNIQTKSVPLKTWTRTQVRSWMEVPSPYYLNRGYSKEILDKYDVGFFKQKNRSIFPVYDDDHDKIIGFTERTCFEKHSCGYYHEVGSPCPKTHYEIQDCGKWKNVGFESNSVLYNYWFSKNYITDSTIVGLVEGPGDVLKLEENGIKNSVAMFGVDLTDEQRVILDRSGALSVVVMLDNDEAGRKGCIEIKKKLGRLYRLYFPKIQSHDVGDLHKDSITQDIAPFLKKVKDL